MEFYKQSNSFSKAHGNFTLARFSSNCTHCLRRFERSDCDCTGVSLSR